MDQDKKQEKKTKQFFSKIPYYQWTYLFAEVCICLCSIKDSIKIKSINLEFVSTITKKITKKKNFLFNYQSLGFFKFSKLRNSFFTTLIWYRYSVLQKKYKHCFSFPSNSVQFIIIHDELVQLHWTSSLLLIKYLHED